LNAGLGASCVSLTVPDARIRSWPQKSQSWSLQTGPIFGDPFVLCLSFGVATQIKVVAAQEYEQLKSIFDIDYYPTWEVSFLLSQYALGNFFERQSRINSDFKAFAKPAGQKVKVFFTRFYNKKLCARRRKNSLLCQQQMLSMAK
jgi:hypothetical protein